MLCARIFVQRRKAPRRILARTPTITPAAWDIGGVGPSCEHICSDTTPRSKEKHANSNRAPAHRIFRDHGKVRAHAGISASGLFPQVEHVCKLVAEAWWHIQQRFDANAIMSDSLVPFRPEGGCSYHVACDGWQRVTTQRHRNCFAVCRPNCPPLFFMVAQFSSAYYRHTVDLRCNWWGFWSMDPFMSQFATLGTRTLCPTTPIFAP
eukprot:6491612-Amphidinium_carterae.3